MGSGTRPRNVPPTPADLGSGGFIHCPQKGRTSATVLNEEQADEVGSLILNDDGLLLIVGEEPVAQVHDERLRECVDAGFTYLAVLERHHDPPSIRYWS